MAEIVRMPKLSDTMTEGTVAAWHKKVGDKVKSGEVLAEIETDKATMEFESFQDGVLLHIGVEKGKTAKVDSILAILGKEGEDITALLAADATAAPATATATAPPAATAPAATPVAAPVASAIAVAAPVAAPASSNGRLKASPLAKKIAEEKGIDIGRVAGSGDGGRIVRRDVENFTPAAGSAAPAYVPAFIPAGTERYSEENVSQMRKTIARRLAESKFTAPHFYLTMEIDMDNAMAARKAINDSGTAKISFNDMVVKACAMALRQHPKVNSSWRGETIRYNEHVHIGVAVAVDEGLLVPVVRFANEKGLSQIGAEVKSFAEKAKSKKLQPSDWEGNTFTISNLGMFGIEEFTAIINPPDACILAVGGIKAVPVVKNGAVVPGNVMKVTLSCDHRVVDGASGAAFLQTLKAFLENPVMMIV
jgi:pyruvate dehydrogenase E2 component (dihydrolipoamide acetyltransferase)